MENIKPGSGRSITTPTIDFLLLGGASLWVWIIMLSLHMFKGPAATGANPFFYFAVAFTWLSILCNYPHFLISYRFGYGRGKGFILKNWPALIAVPALLILFYLISYYFFNEQIRSQASVIWINSILNSTGMDFQLGALPNLGIEILSVSVRLMFVTAAWHYCKQAFGCVMVFSHYHNYPLTRFQRNLWKASLYSVAVYNFFYISNLTTKGTGPFSFFIGVPVTNISFPEIFTSLSLIAVVLLAVFVIYFILIKNYQRYKKKPTSSIMIPWIALHFWWIPFIGHHDFYFLAVPFFHSLQYLLFAYQLETPEYTTLKRKKIIFMVLKMLALMLAGFLAFEYVPKYLDSALSTESRLRVVFFLVAIPVFINIHHFFIDSVVWRFSDEHVRKKLLD